MTPKQAAEATPSFPRGQLSVQERPLTSRIMVKQSSALFATLTASLAPNLTEVKSHFPRELQLGAAAHLVLQLLRAWPAALGKSSLPQPCRREAETREARQLSLFHPPLVTLSNVPPNSHIKLQKKHLVCHMA